MGLPDHCPYTDYSHIRTIGQLGDSYMSASVVKSTSADGTKYAYQCQGIDISGPAQDVSYLKECSQSCYYPPSQIPITSLSASLDPYPIVSRTTVAVGLCSGAAGTVDLEHVSIQKVWNQNFKVCRLLYWK